MLHHRGFFAGRHHSEQKEEEEDKKERKKNECSKKVLSDMRFRPHDPPFLYAAARKKKLRSKSGALPLRAAQNNVPRRQKHPLDLATCVFASLMSPLNEVGK